MIKHLTTLVLFVALAFGVQARHGTKFSNVNSPMGMGLEGIIYYSPEVPFLNLMKQAEAPWFGPSGNCSSFNGYCPFPIDANGYPTSLTSLDGTVNANAETQFLVTNVTSYNTNPTVELAGNYVLLWNGTGTVVLNQDATLVSSGSGSPRAAPDNWAIYNVATPSAAGIGLWITGTPVTNIRVIYAGTNCRLQCSVASTAGTIGTREALFNSGEIFNPDFVDLIKPFKVLRIMDWRNTNGNLDTVWAANSGTVTNTIGTATFTLNNHGFVNQTEVWFTTTGTLPTGISPGVHYWVNGNNLSTNTFEISTIPGGNTNHSLPPTSIVTSGSQSGTHTVFTRGRTTPSWVSWAAVDTGAGIGTYAVPIETAVALVNETGADLWLNVPQGATDNYILQEAAYVHANLQYQQKVYLEYSNEYWNFAVAGGKPSSPAGYMVQQGQLKWTNNVVVTNGTADFPWTNHGFSVNAALYFPNTAPTGFTADPNSGTNYYVISTGLTANSFRLAASPGGAAITPTSSGTFTIKADQASGGRSFYGMQMQHVCSLWKTAWGSDATRIKCMTEGQSTDTSVARDTLFCLHYSGAPCTAGIDAINLAVYFGYNDPPDSWQTPTLSFGLNQMYQEIVFGGTTPTGSGANTTTGSANAYVLTSDASWGNGSIPATPANAQPVQFVANFTNSGAATIKVDGGNVIPLQDRAGNALASGAVVNGGTYVAFYTTAGTAGWRISDSPAFPGGMIAQVISWINAHQTLISANFPGMVLYGYEGGTGFQPVCDAIACYDAAAVSLMISTSSDWHMFPAFGIYLDRMQAAGLVFYNQFVDVGPWNQFGMWGSLNNLSPNSGPKYNGMVDWVRRRSH